MKTFNQISQSAGYKADDVSVSVTVCGGSYGGGSEVLVVEPIVFRDDITIKVDEDGIGFTLGARDFKGVQCVSYQTVTGTVSQGAHPGSYNGQDAYNDMLVVDDESNKHRQRSDAQHQHDGNRKSNRLYARCTGSIDRGGWRNE